MRLSYICCRTQRHADIVIYALESAEEEEPGLFSVPQISESNDFTF